MKTILTLNAIALAMSLLLGANAFAGSKEEKNTSLIVKHESSSPNDSFASLKPNILADGLCTLCYPVVIGFGIVLVCGAVILMAVTFALAATFILTDCYRCCPGAMAKIGWTEETCRG